MPDMNTLPAAGDVSADTHVDVLIAGAGISGIGAAYHLQTQCPGKTYLILEALESFGGTWLTHRYPGVRSDSDLYTFGYRFKPWTGTPIATGDEIQKYLGEVISENNIAPQIRYRHRILTAEWSSEQARWTIEGSNLDTGAPFRVTANFLWMCQGYYRHDKGYTPDWPGMETFRGRIVHPQTWPQDLDYAGKRVVLIGSGATAATVVPAIAQTCEHVTVLQRSPTYFFPGQNVNELADQLRVLEVDETWIHEITRRKILFDQHIMTELARHCPEEARQQLLDGVAALLPPGYDVARHFSPRYRPWQQRLAFVPDGDLFKGISAGKASMVTDEIACFNETGIRTKSGEQLDADIIISATGFNLSVLGDIAFTVDGKPVDFSQTVTYRGMMFTGVPNLVWVFGYFRASWTLRVDLVGDLVCRLLKHMDAIHASKVEVQIPEADQDMEILPWMDPENFNPGYLMRSQHLMPRRGSKPAWQHTQDYWVERDELPKVDLTEAAFVYA
jgi:cation diffusion facilitator CzcD-associated flavoprotein CzcO